MIGWSVELSEFGLKYEPRGSVKGQYLADFVAELPQGGQEHTQWMLFVDGSSGRQGGGAGIVLEGPNGIMVEQALIFRFKVSNNQAEYKALIAGLELAMDLGIKSLGCRTDSQLVEGHMNGTFQVKDEQLLQYYHKAARLMRQFKTVELKYIPRGENVKADRLSKLTTDKERGQLTSLIRQVLFKPAIECLHVGCMAERDDWRREIMLLIKKQDEGNTLRPEEAKQTRYIVIGEELYRRGYVTPMLKCLSREESKYVMRELYEGICGRHDGGRSLRAQALRAGFYWTTMERDCQTFVQKCIACQKFGNIIHEPAIELHSLVSPWPFAQWGMDIVGPFPTGQSQFKFLLVAVDYFTKWVEAEPLARITAAQVQKFVWKLICRFEIPKFVITDNGRQFVDRKLVAFYKELGIIPLTSFVEHPQTNGLVEAMNKIIVQELKKKLGDAKGAWVDELQQVLWGYRCSPHSATGESPFNLTYGTNAMLPVEVGADVLRRQPSDMRQNAELLTSDLDVLSERREMAAVRVEAQK